MLLAIPALWAAASPAVYAADEKLPAGLKVARVTAYPAKIELKHTFDYRQILITGHLESGETVDLTRMAKREDQSPQVTVSATGQVRPQQDGKGQLVFRYGSHSANIPFSVQNAQKAPQPSFVRDVIPLLGKMGCNAGTCHGSKGGKGGFKLSLRGYDALFDHRALTDDVGARRFNRAAPDQSLMLLKATGSIPHVGGVRTQVDTPYYKIVRSWIASGAALDLGSARVRSIRVTPENPILPRAGMKQQIAVLATYTDGSVRDVTREAFIESGNIEVIEADEQGLLTMLRRGEAPVLVRYEGAYAATTLTVMGDRSGFVWKETPEFNYIDKLVYAKLRRVRVSPAELCSDEDFVRRVYLDITGLPPTPEQIGAFLQTQGDTRTRRNALIDQLVGNAEYIEHWTNKWADLLQVNRKFLGEEGAIALRNWIKAAVAANKPYDRFAYEVLTARGSTFENPPASYYKVLRTPQDLMENTTHLFLAVRFNCNKCHDHPFERWTQDQYYNLAAYFAQIGRKPDAEFAGRRIGGTAVEGAKPLVEVVFDRPNGDIKHDRTGEIAPPAFPYEHGDAAPATASRRQKLAHWITSPKNQYFAKSYVNRLWGYMFGRGIIEPIDDIRAGNPPTNPELLDALTRDFIDSGFNVQHMLRTICKSRTYQHSVQTNRWNEDDTINNSHAIPRRLPAEVLYDAIHVATGSVQRIQGVPVGFRAAELPDVGVKVPFLDDFGRPVRESACECERSSGVVLGPIMKLVNGPTVANALNDPQNALAKLVAEEKDDRKVIEQVFLRFFARKPTRRELQLSLAAMSAAGKEYQQLQKALSDYEAKLDKKQVAWEKSLGRVTSWTVVEPQAMKSKVGAQFTKQSDKSVRVTGTLKQDVYTITLHSDDPAALTGLRLEALNDKSLPAGGPGRAKNGNFVLSEISVTAAPKSDPTKSKPVKLQNPAADFNQQGYAVGAAIDGNLRTGWAVSPQFGKPHHAIFEFADEVEFKGGVLLTVRLQHNFDPQHLIGRFRLSLTTSPRPIRLKKLPAALASALKTEPAKRTAAQKKLLTDEFRKQDPLYRQMLATTQRAAEQAKNPRLTGIQDVAWALINNPAFLFNR